MNILDLVINSLQTRETLDNVGAKIFSEVKIEKHNILRFIVVGSNFLNEDYFTRFYHNALNTGRIDEWLNCTISLSENGTLNKIDLINLEFTGNGIGLLGLMDLVLKGKYLGIFSSKKLTILRPETVGNEYFLNLIAQHADVKYCGPCPSSIEEQKYLHSHIDGLVYCEDEGMFWARAMAYVYDKWNKFPEKPLLVMPSIDRKRRFDYLKEFGCSEKNWFVCLHVCEGRSKNENKYTGPHNADISTYFDTIKMITDSGSWVVRIGDAKMKPLPDMKMVIDYAHASSKNAMLDIFFWKTVNFSSVRLPGPQL